MKLQQLRYIYEVARHELNVSATAESLYTSQPGVSKQIRLLEDELGVQIFTRSGKHLTDITPAGRQVLDVAARMLRDAQSIKEIAKEYSQPNSGTLRIGATPIVARYLLPQRLDKLAREFPKVNIEIHQGEEGQFTEWLRDGVVDVVLTMRAAALHDTVFVPCTRWRYAWLQKSGKSSKPVAPSLLVFSPDDSMAEHLRAQLPVEKSALRWSIVSADPEVIKAYVRLDWGLGLIPALAFDSIADSDLSLHINGENLPEGLIYLGFRRDLYWRKFTHAFALLMAQHFKPEWLNKAAHCRHQDELSELVGGETLPIN